VNQELTWSMTVTMKIGLIGPGRCGVALGINETAGHLGVAVTALAAGSAGAFLLGVGTSLVYPTRSRPSATRPRWTAPALGV
jgi:hypothetical protein